MENKLSDYLFKDPDEMTTCPVGVVVCIRDRWWLVDAQGRIGFYVPLGVRSKLPENQRRGFTGMSLCYDSQDEAWVVARDRAPSIWAVDVVFLPFVFRPIDMIDFCD